MPSKFTRRNFLGGVAVTGTATATGYKFLPANLLPNVVLEERTKRQSVPKVDTSLSVSSDAVSDSRDHLQDLIDRAEAAWKEVDDSDVNSQDEEFDRSLDSLLDTAREKLSEAKGKDATTDTLRILRYGINRAGWSLAAAKAISDEYEVESLRKRSKQLYSDISDFSDSMSYEVADPRRGLAYLHRAERALYFARMDAYGKVHVSGESLTKSEYDYREVVSTIRGAIEGRRWLADSKAIYEAHRSNVADAGESTDLEAHLGQAWQAMADRIDAILLDREIAIERYFPDEKGPRDQAMRELFNNGYSAGEDAPSPSYELREGLLAYVAVEHAKALQHALGFESSIEALDTTFENGGVSMQLAAETKTDAIARLESLFDESDDPITRELLARPREEIVIGDWPLGLNPNFDSEYPYAEAYAFYLLAAKNVQHTSEVRESLLP